MTKSKVNKYDFIARWDGRVEWTCKHGVGHTIYVPLRHKNEQGWWIHGCDGCCMDKKRIDDVNKEFVRRYGKSFKNLPKVKFDI
ncbi:MAG: hypothetical protein ACREBJ_10295 [Nitrosotalea sp.]